MQEVTPSKKIWDRFQKSLFFSIEHFRKGNDHLGLDNFGNSMDDLETLLELAKYGGVFRDMHKIIALLQDLYVFMQNKDIVSMTDILEFKLYPLTKEWVMGCDEE